MVLLSHSREGNQIAWFSAEQDDPVIKKVILVAPQTLVCGCLLVTGRQRVWLELEFIFH